MANRSSNGARMTAAPRHRLRTRWKHRILRADKRLKIWDGTGKQLRTIEGFPDIALSVAISQMANAPSP